jgi:hypothetical protein
LLKDEDPLKGIAALKKEVQQVREEKRSAG